MERRRSLVGPTWDDFWIQVEKVLEEACKTGRWWRGNRTNIRQLDHGVPIYDAILLLDYEQRRKVLLWLRHSIDDLNLPDRLLEARIGVLTRLREPLCGPTFTRRACSPSTEMFLALSLVDDLASLYDVAGLRQCLGMSPKRPGMSPLSSPTVRAAVAISHVPFPSASRAVMEFAARYPISGGILALAEAITAGYERLEADFLSWSEEGAGVDVLVTKWLRKIGKCSTRWGLVIDRLLKAKDDVPKRDISENAKDWIARNAARLDFDILLCYERCSDHESRYIPLGTFADLILEARDRLVNDHCMRGDVDENVYRQLIAANFSFDRFRYLLKNIYFVIDS